MPSNLTIIDICLTFPGKIDIALITCSDLPGAMAWSLTALADDLGLTLIVYIAHPATTCLP